MKKVMFGLVMLVSVLAQADIAPQPRHVHRLHRVGYEILNEVHDSSPGDSGLLKSPATLDQVPEYRSTPVDWGMVFIFLGISGLLGVLLAVSAAVWRKGWKGKCSVVSLWMVGGLSLSAWIMNCIDEMMSQAMNPSWESAVIYENESGWKYEDAVRVSEREEFIERVRSLREELQEAVNISGIEVFRAQHWQEEGTERKNKIEAVESVLAENDELRMKCKGIPIEYMIDDLVFGLYAQNLRRFERWARAQSLNLSESENTVLFRWQRFVCRKERRNWMQKFADDKFMRPGRTATRPMPCIPFGFEDFEDKTSDGVAFVRYWHEKAESLGFKMQALDRDLFARATQARPRLSENLEVNARHLAVNGPLSVAEIRALADYWKVKGLGSPIDLSSLNPSKNDANERRTEAAVAVQTGTDTLDVVLDEVDNATLRAVCETLGKRVGTLSMKATGGADCDLEPLAMLSNLREVKLENCRVSKAQSLKRTNLLKFVAEDCDLGDIALLKGVSGVSEIMLDRCGFTMTGHLGGSVVSCHQVLLRDSKSQVDLSFAAKLIGTEHGYIEIDGRHVPSYLGGLEKLDISGSKVTNIFELVKCRALKEVVYTSAELTEMDRGFLKELSAGGGRRIELHDATRERIDEIKRSAVRRPQVVAVSRLVKAGGDVKELWRGYWTRHGRNPDDEYVREMLAKGADVNEQMQFGTALGQLAGNRDLEGATNRLAVMTTLLEKGADPNVEPKYDKTVLDDIMSWPSVSGRVDMVRMLLEKGANPNRAGRMGRTAIDELFTFGLDDEKLEIARLLLIHGADVKDRKLLQTIHQWKIDHGKFELVKELVEKGAAVTDMAIGSGWKDEQIRKYLLRQVGKSESDYEVTVRETGFSIRSARRASCEDRERPEHDFSAAAAGEAFYKMEARHRESMERMREHREHRRQFEEMQCQHDESEGLRQLDVIRQHVERERQEILGSVPSAKRDAFAKWLEERHKEEESRWAELRQRVARSREEAQGRTDKANADIRTRQEEMRNQVLRNEREQIRRQREGGAPEWVHREHELHLRRMEMHHEIARERDLGMTYLNYGPGIDMGCAVNEYRNWLDRRVCEEKERASSESQRTRNGDDAAAWRSAQRAVE